MCGALHFGTRFCDRSSPRFPMVVPLSSTIDVASETRRSLIRPLCMLYSDKGGPVTRLTVLIGNSGKYRGGEIEIEIEIEIERPEAQRDLNA